MYTDVEVFDFYMKNEDIEEVEKRIVKRSEHNFGDKQENENEVRRGVDENSIKVADDETLKPSKTIWKEDKEPERHLNENQNGEEFVVLDPDHPQMQKFQKSLKELLEKKTAQLSIENKELNELIKRKRSEREEIGVQLYNNQQELLKQQTNLQRQSEMIEKIILEKQKNDQNLIELKKKMEKKVMHLGKEKSKLNELQTELDNLNLRIFYLEHAKENIAGDIASMKRAAVKSEFEMKKAEEIKQNQDLFVERLTRKAIKLSEELEDLKNQLSDQIEETRLAKEAMHESQMELESLNSEKKKLIQDWNSSLVALKKREETLVNLTQDLSKLEENSQMLTKEKEGLQKLFKKEEEQNEILMSMLSRIEFDIQRVDKQAEQLKKEIDSQQDRSIQLTKILEETDRAYNNIIDEKTQQEFILDQQRRDIEKLHKEKTEIEDRLMEKVQQQITLNTATKYKNIIIHRIRDRTKELDNQIADIENELSKKSMEETHLQIENSYLEKILQEYNLDLQEKNNLVTKNGAEINQKKILIERKQNQIDVLSKKIDEISSQTGVKDASPLEIQIKSLQKSITSTHEEIQQIEQLWLKDQAELVKLMNLKNKEEESMEHHKNEITIYTQKLMRVEGQLAGQNKELHEIDKSINDMKHDTVKLNTLICKEKGSGEALAQTQKLSIKDFEASLKESEKEVIEMQGKLESLKEENENLYNSLVESEKQIMLWNKKIQLAQETKTSVDREIQDETRVATNEVHRMEARLHQLEKDCEKRCLEMERLLANREINLIKGEALKSKGHSITQNGLKREATAIKRKIKEIAKELETYDSHRDKLTEENRRLDAAITSEKTTLKLLTEESAKLESEIENISEEKQKAFIDTIIGQQRMKCYQQLKENKYKKSVKSLEGEYKKQLENMRSTLSVLNNLMHEYPEAGRMLKKATLIYGSRAL